MIATVLIIHQVRTIDFGADGIAGAILNQVIQSEGARGDETASGSTYRVSGQQPSVDSKLHDQGPVRCHMLPFSTFEGSVVVTDGGMIPAKHQTEVATMIVFQEHPLQVHIKSLCIAFAQRDFSEDTGSFVDSGRKQQIKVAGIKAACRTALEPESA